MVMSEAMRFRHPGPFSHFYSPRHDLKLGKYNFKKGDMLSIHLHNCVHEDACIIHRDIKPDNIGFASDGCLKLLDFGLCTLVKKGKSKDDAYKMTGNTGSLRYMAPEVVLRKAYNSSVDVYSFGILLWQMARDQVPFKGLTKEQFVKEVVLGGLRPKIDKSWPPGFSSRAIRTRRQLVCARACKRCGRGGRCGCAG